MRLFLRCRSHNERHDSLEHHYIVSIDDVTGELMACSVRIMFTATPRKHIAAVENATDDGTLEASPLENHEDDFESGGAIVTISVASRAGHAYKWDEQNCRTNN